MGGFRALAGPLAAAALLAACQPATEPPVRPLPARPVSPTPKPPSEASIAARAHYARVERDLKSQGLLRSDDGRRDAPFTAEDLAGNFMRVALYDELVDEGGTFVARERASELRRWEGPIRMRAVFGDSVPEAQRMKDLATLADYAARLSRVTGLTIRMTEGADANFDVVFLAEDERWKSAGLLRSLVPTISTTAINTVITLPRDVFCMVFAISDGESPVYRQAVAVIRAEHPDTLRTACIHEEIAQALGLPNDSRTARPSIFNDDEEFGLLTPHDELLLRILYDRRLKPGMKAEEARPIVERIARELVGGES
ncbi:MAG: DUF2927 domain-containing protein [Rhodobacteraceae bacterium]|nr:DUF2927 domain-containing protein [Paracoccaceae bacterium]